MWHIFILNVKMLFLTFKGIHIIIVIIFPALQLLSSYVLDSVYSLQVPAREPGTSRGGLEGRRGRLGQRQ